MAEHYITREGADEKRAERSIKPAFFGLLDPWAPITMQP